MEHITTAEAAAFVSAQPPSVQLEPPSAHECDRYFLVGKAPDPYAPRHRYDRDDARSSSARRSRRITSSTTATRSSKCVRFEPFRMGMFVQLQRTRHAEGRPRRTREEWRVASGSRSPLRVTVATRAALRRALTPTIRSDRDDARRRATSDSLPLATTATTRAPPFEGGIRPHMFCLPILKAETHRRALVAAATGPNAARFFAGTDSAPHPGAAKYSACGCAGVFTAHAAVELCVLRRRSALGERPAARARARPVVATPSRIGSRNSRPRRASRVATTRPRGALARSHRDCQETRRVVAAVVAAAAEEGRAPSRARRARGGGE